MCLELILNNRFVFSFICNIYSIHAWWTSNHVTNKLYILAYKIFAYEANKAQGK